ncbi:MAG TPA: CheB methylesterase domain-containing protein, partial [Candidatus Xenobia bacterium]
MFCKEMGAAQRTPRGTVEVERRVKVVAMGASTGGPAALQCILSGLPRDFPVPILVVQHIAPGFLDGLVTWLSDLSGFPIHIATAYQSAMPGHVYFAPDGAHLGITRHGVLTLSREPSEHLVRPSVSYLFRSVAASFPSRSVGVLLTGMGRDGADELKLMKERGAYTI